MPAGQRNRCGARVRGVASLLVVTALLVVTLTAVVPTGAAPNTAAPVQAQPVQEVRPIDTTELGLPRPTGVAYDPSASTLVVATRGGAETRLVRVTTGEDLVGSLTLPPVETSTLTFDPRTNRLGAIGNQELLTVPEDQLSAAAPTPGRAPLGAAGVGRPSGAAFDASGGLLVLDAAGRSIVRIQDAGAANSVTRIPLGIGGNGPLRGLAFNPADGLLYVGSPTEQLLYGLDGAGVLRAAFDLSPLGLADPQGFTFAPSADTTDDPPTQHLYVADGGGWASFGSVMEASLAPAQVSAASVVTATLVKRIATSAWSPASPDPSGIEYIPGLDRLEVCDSEVDEVTGAGYHNVNLWQITRAGAVTDTGTTWTPAPAFSKEPTGLGFSSSVDPASNTLFISDDSAHRIWIDKAGPDLRLGTGDDVVTSIDMLQYGSNDTEDPEYDPSTGHLFFIDGVNTDVYEINPVDGIFGNGNDTMTHFDVGQYGPTDIEGLGSDPAHNTLLVGGRVTKQIYEVTKTGALVQTIDASGISGMRYISGLAQAPASDNSGRKDYGTVDRNIDNGSNSGENDGQLFELTIPSSGNTAPVVNAGPDQSIVPPQTSVNVSGTVTDDGLPNPPGTTTHTWTQVSGPETVTFTDASALATTVSGLTSGGDYVLRLTASDSALSSFDELTVHVAGNQAPTVNAGPDQTISAPQTSVSVSGTVTDDGLPNPPGTTTHTWSQTSGPATVTFGNASALATTVNGFSAIGDYVLRLTANDSALSSFDELTVHVVANQAPVVNAGPDQSIASPTSSVSLNGTATDDGFPNPPAAMTYAWSRISGPTVVSFADASALSTTASGLTDPGDYVLRLTANDGSLSSFDELTVHVSAGGTFTVDVPVATGSDDAEQKPTGAVTVTSSDLDMMTDVGSTSTTVQTAVGIRFANVTVPPGATINNAYVQFTADEATTDATSLQIEGEAADNPATFAATSNNISSRLRTAAKVTWNPIAWATAGAQGVDQRSSDLTPIVQELTLRSGWSSGNALTLIITGSGRRVARSFEASLGGRAVLHVVYSVGGPPPNQPPVVNAGPDQTIILPDSATLNGSVTDDGLPNPPATVTQQWSQESGPGTVTFADATAPSTTASFSQIGTYVLRLTGSDSILTALDDLTVEVLGPGSIITKDIPLAAGSDDAEQKSSGAVTLTSTDLDMMIDGTKVQTTVGLRFANVTVPKNVTILSAYVQFTADEAHSDSTSLLIQGQDADNPATFAAVTNNISSRPRTTQQVTWNPVGWTTVGAQGVDQQTSDLAPIIQPLVQRAGWSSGNALALIITGSGRRVARAFEATVGGKPVLHVVYQL